MTRSFFRNIPTINLGANVGFFAPPTFAALHRTPWCNGALGTSNTCPGQDALQYEQYRKDELAKGIQNIFYINLDKNKLRRTNMEKALRQQNITKFQRISAIRGQEPPSVCLPGLQHPKRCRGVQGVLRSNLHIMQNHDVTNASISLIFEDDFILKNFTLLQEAITWVPPDWDIIRLECVDYEIRPSFDYFDVPLKPSLVFRANYVRPCNQSCGYCGGLFAMVWRSSSVSKLWNLWSKPPVGDPDCALAWAPNIRSYCINTHGKIGQHQPPWKEDSDIPKL